MNIPINRHSTQDPRRYPSLRFFLKVFIKSSTIKKHQVDFFVFSDILTIKRIKFNHVCTKLIISSLDLMISPCNLKLVIYTQKGLGFLYYCRAYLGTVIDLSRLLYN